MNIPEGYIVEQTESSLIIVRKDLHPELTTLLSVPPWEKEERFEHARWLNGRGPIPAISLNSNTTVILRTYRHGGLLSGFTGNIFIGRPRPFRELELSIEARKRGIPTPAVLGGAIYPVAGPIYRGVLAIEEIPEASDGLDILRRARELPCKQREQLFKKLLPEAGKLIGLCHNKGLVHTDLNVKNIVVSGTPFGVHIIDLDRCRLEKESLSDSKRRLQLERLFRSLKKVSSMYNLSPFTSKEANLFLTSYARESKLSLKKTLSYFGIEGT